MTFARTHRLPAAPIALALLVSACADDGPVPPLVPVPVEVEIDSSGRFQIGEATRILVHGDGPEVERIGRWLAALIGNRPEDVPAVVRAGPAGPADIRLELDPRAAIPPEGYELTISEAGVHVRASGPAGLFYGSQTFRQLLPAAVEYAAAFPSPLTAPYARIVDAPRFPWRGSMLDVARHFVPVESMKRYIDLMALHKLNRLHLHLSDDQGWRIEVPGWPDLTRIGGTTQVGGGPGGFYTSAEYGELVRYAADRFITVVPEIDVPGHINAALASYPELNCDGVSPDLYTGTAVGFSSLCVDLDVTYAFLADVIREISALTPGPWFHVGGDEVRELTDHEYVTFIERVQALVEANGKRMIGWDEVASASLNPESVVQLWRPLWDASEQEESGGEGSESARVLAEGVARSVEAGASFILSPADRVYLDMKYDTTTVLGLSWAGYSDVRRAYDWEPRDVFSSIPEDHILGIEAPLWSETVQSFDDFEYMAFPRLAGIAELGWSPAAAREWESFRRRLAAQAPRWTALGINFSRSPSIPWERNPVGGIR